MISALYRGYVHARRRVAILTAERRQGPPFDPASVREVLLVVVGLLGDTLMCLPAISAVRRHFREARVTGLVSDQNRRLLGMTSFLDDAIVVSGSAFSVRSSPRRLEREAAARVRDGGYDLAVIFLGDDYAPMLTRARIPQRVFVAESILGSLGTHCYSIGDARAWGPLQRQAAWTALGLPVVAATPRLRPPDGACQSVSHRLARLNAGPLVVVHPYGRTAAQWWPARTACDFVRQAGEQLGVRTVLIGGARERAAADHAYRELASSVDLDLVGRLSLEELTALMDRADCVVSTDSGPYHLAGTQGRPTVALFRASRPEHAHRYRAATPIIAPAVAECQRYCRWDHCRANPCEEMLAIASPQVMDAVMIRLGDGDAR